jgi:hypothetical protein
MAGIVTGTCLSQSVIAARKDGFEVYFVSDCSGDVTTEAHEDGKALMAQAGAHPITWMNASGQWAPDYTSKERALMTPIYTKYGGGGTNFLVDYVVDQIAAGVVPPPAFMSAPVEVGSR